MSTWVVKKRALTEKALPLVMPFVSVAFQNLVNTCPTRRCAPRFEMTLQGTS